MITVWGRATSGNVQMVMWAISELGLAHRRIDAGGAFGGLDSEEYRSMNPNKLVPVVQDGDGPYLWESAAIVRYLGARYGSEQFLATRSVEAGDRRQVGGVDQDDVRPGLHHRRVLAADWGEAGRAQPGCDRPGSGEARRPRRYFRWRCADRGFFGGDAPCFADIMTGTLLYRYSHAGVRQGRDPRLTAYYERLCARPAYAENVMISYDSLRAK